MTRSTHWLLLIGVAAGITNSLAQVNPLGITCTIDGKTNSFSKRATAVYSKQDGLEIMGFSEGTPENGFFTIQIPDLKIGTFTSRDTPSLRFSYTRNVFSSNSGEQFSAIGTSAQSSLKVTIRKIGVIGKTVEGSFSGVLENHLHRRLLVTNGLFSVVLNENNTKP